MVVPKIYVLHENDLWTAPLAEALSALEAPFELMHLSQGVLDLGAPPPPGIFYSRMSASSHTRGHRYAAEYTGCVLRWLEAHGRLVLNGSHALALEVSKVAQYAALEADGILTPRTVAASGREQVIDAARSFAGPFITKHNRGGKGLGVRKFEEVAALIEYVDGSDYDEPVDGITLVQAYIESPEQVITRCEFVGGRFMYAVQVDTSEGFELCPADACGPEDELCPADGRLRPKFRILEDFHSPLIEQYEAFLAANDIAVAGIEFIVDAEGRAYTYDINTNTNYNPAAESAAGHSGMDAIARYLMARLGGARLSDAPVASAA